MCYVLWVVSLVRSNFVASRAFGSLVALMTAGAFMAALACNSADVSGENAPFAESPDAPVATENAELATPGPSAHAPVARGASDGSALDAPVGLDDALATEARPLRAVPTDRPRVYAKSRNVWIRG